MPGRHKNGVGDAELVAEFLRAIERVPVLEASSESGLDVQAIMTLRRGYTGELRVTMRERISSYLLRKSLPAPGVAPARGQLVWSDSAPAPARAHARLGEIDGYGVAEVATRTGSELLVFGTFFPIADKPGAQIPAVTKFHGYVVDGGRSAEIDAPVRVEVIGPQRANDAPIYFGGRIKA